MDCMMVVVWNKRRRASLRVTTGTACVLIVRTTRLELALTHGTDKVHVSLVVLQLLGRGEGPGRDAVGAARVRRVVVPLQGQLGCKQLPTQCTHRVGDLLVALQCGGCAKSLAGAVRAWVGVQRILVLLQSAWRYKFALTVDTARVCEQTMLAIGVGGREPEAARFAEYMGVL